MGVLLGSAHIELRSPFAVIDARDWVPNYDLNHSLNTSRPDGIRKVIFNNPATIVIWKDGSKTVVKCQDGDTFDPEKGLAMAISRRFLGDTYDYYNVFEKWLPKERRRKNA